MGQKWNFDYLTKIFIVKSKLCERGFVEKQKHDVQRHSGKASRLSQKLIVSTPQTHPDFELESWGISTALFQGRNFDEIRRRSRELKRTEYQEGAPTSAG